MTYSEPGAEGGSIMCMCLLTSNLWETVEAQVRYHLFIDTCPLNKLFRLIGKRRMFRGKLSQGQQIPRGFRSLQRATKGAHMEGLSSDLGYLPQGSFSHPRTYPSIILRHTNIPKICSIPELICSQVGFSSGEI